LLTAFFNCVSLHQEPNNISNHHQQQEVKEEESSKRPKPKYSSAREAWRAAAGDDI
jgi:hypothetical protein